MRVAKSDASFKTYGSGRSPGFTLGLHRIYLFILDLFLPMISHIAVHPPKGVLLRPMRPGGGAAPAGSVSSTEPPGASGDIARPNYVGPSGNGLVERMKAGESPWDQGRSNGL